MPNDDGELFARLCQVGNALEDVRDDQYRQGALWLRLDAVLTQLDGIIETLVAPPPALERCARHAGRGGRGDGCGDGFAPAAASAAASATATQRIDFAGMSAYFWVAKGWRYLVQYRGEDKYEACPHP